ERRHRHERPSRPLRRHPRRARGRGDASRRPRRPLAAAPGAVRVAATRPDDPTPPDRAAWRAQRAAMEAHDEKHKPVGPRHRRWGQFKRLLITFRIFLRATRLFDAGVRRALDIRLVERVLAHPDLPPEFDGYRLLHLTDLHLDGMPGLDA